MRVKNIMRVIEFKSYALVSFREGFSQALSPSFHRMGSGYSYPFFINEEEMEEGIFYSKNRGTFSKIKVSPYGLEIEPDYLGTRIIFYYQGKDFCVVGNDVEVMVKALCELGVTIEIDYLSLGTTFALGGQQVANTPIKGMKMLPLGEKAVMSHGRVHRIMQQANSEYVTKEVLKLRAAEEVLSNVESIAAYDDERLIVEMTGGVDSRVVFSAVMAAKLQDRIDFVTYGGPDHPDRIIAERAAYAFDIDMVDRPYSEEDISPSKYLEGGYALAGIRWLDDVSFRMTQSQKGFSALTGGLGESFRNFYAEVVHKKHGKKNEFFGRQSSSDSLSYFFDAFSNSRFKYLKNAQEVKEGVVNQMLAYEDSVGGAFFRHYTEFRNRIHYGGATVNRSRFINSFDPLYTPSGYELAKRMDAEWQLFGDLSFFLIGEFFPPVLSIPFAEKKASAAFLQTDIAKKCIIKSNPMEGLKSRESIKNINKYNFKRPIKSDSIGLYFDQVLNELPDDFLDKDVLERDIMKNPSYRMNMYRSLSSIFSLFDLLKRSC